MEHQTESHEETSGCLDVMLPPTPDCPEPTSIRFILMTEKSHLEMLHSGKLQEPSANESKNFNSDQVF